MAVKRAAYSSLSGTSGKRLQAWTPTISGGTLTTAGGYNIYTFSSSGTLNTSIPTVVEYLIIGAGGSCAGSAQGGNRESGSGAGGYLSGITFLSNLSNSIVVGNYVAGKNNGQNTTAFNLISYGGGAAANNDFQAGNAGGSGGGGWYGGAGGAGVSGQGNAGGSPGTGFAGGGGGGAGAGGGAPAGGSGLSNSIGGSAYTYCTGGYANTYQSTVYNQNATTYGSGAWGIGNGFNGIVIVRLPI
jgi:hypothetical protein